MTQFQIMDHENCSCSYRPDPFIVYDRFSFVGLVIRLNYNMSSSTFPYTFPVSFMLQFNMYSYWISLENNNSSVNWNWIMMPEHMHFLKIYSWRLKEIFKFLPYMSLWIIISSSVEIQQFSFILIKLMSI